MGTAKLNIWLKNINCSVIPNCWRTDLVIQECNGAYLVDNYPEVLDQIRKYFSEHDTPASVDETTTYPVPDQNGKTIQLSDSAGHNETVTLGYATDQTEVFDQLKDAFEHFTVSMVAGKIRITTKQMGYNTTISVGGSSDLTWGAVAVGTGFRIDKHYYQNAWRILILPPAGMHVNHIEVDVPPGCYKIWTRVCHGNNEETSVVMAAAKCGDHICVNLLLPYLKTCAAHVIHPLMDKVVNEQFLAEDAERVLVMRGVAYAANLGKQELINQLDYRLQEAVEKGDPDLQARVEAVLNLAQLLPECG